MKVKDLIAALQSVNQEANVVISVDMKYSDYTWGTDQEFVSGIITWPHDDPKTAHTVEISS